MSGHLWTGLVAYGKITSPASFTGTPTYLLAIEIGGVCPGETDEVDATGCQGVRIRGQQVAETTYVSINGAANATAKQGEVERMLGVEANNHNMPQGMASPNATQTVGSISITQTSSTSFTVAVQGITAPFVVDLSDWTTHTQPHDCPQD